MEHQKRRKRTMPLKIAMLLVVTSLLAACGGTPNVGTTETAASTAAQGQAGTDAAPSQAAGSAAAAGEVNLWTEFTTGGEGAGIEELIQTWNAKNNGISITHRPIGNEEFFTVVRTGLAGGDPPDLLQYEGYQQTRDFAKAGQLTDITEWWNNHKDRFALSEAGEKACTYEGKVYCMPYTFHTGWQIYYNPEILSQHNIEVPTTFDEFLAAAETLKQNDVTPIALGNKDGWPGEHWWMAFMVQRCGVDKIYDAINRNGVSFTDPCFVQAATDFQSLAQKGYFSAGAASDDYGAAQAVFLSGQAAFFQTGSWFASGWEQEPPPFDVGIMSFPRFSDATNTDDVIGAVTHVFAVPANAADKDAALQVLDWMATDEAATIWAKNGMLSMVEGAVDQSSPPVIKEMWDKVKAAQSSLPWIENELPPGVGEDKIYNGTVALITGSMTPEQFMQSVEDATAAAQ